MSIPTTQLRREIGLWGAIMMGLGSILGTGVFVSIGIAVGIVGPAVIVAVLISAAVAACNGLSSAQLAANHPVSGGTYEYGYRYLRPWLGFSAGWLFLLAKSASAATAALGFAGYLLNIWDVHSRSALVVVALITVLILTAIVVLGIRQSNRTNLVIVSITLSTLVFFVVAGLGAVDLGNYAPFLDSQTRQAHNPLSNLLFASALMFVAYTGYGRIATLGEEVHAPRRTIPRAIIAAMVVTMVVYGAVATVGVGVGGAATMSAATLQHAAPLEIIARSFAVPFAPAVMAVGAMTAMLGVLLNLLLGLSRVLLAMGRRGDMPRLVARLDPTGRTPYVAVIAMGSAVAALTLIGNVTVTWSFSAFTVLIYYALTNLAALQLESSERFYPRWIAWTGLAACLFLAFWVDRQVWLTGLGLLGLGLVWHWLAGRMR